jgi:hypothetical protein
MVLKHFTDHPASVDETYGENFRFANGTGLKIIVGGLACMCHGLMPFAFVSTGSRHDPGPSQEGHRRGARVHCGPDRA